MPNMITHWADNNKSYIIVLACILLSTSIHLLWNNIFCALNIHCCIIYLLSSPRLVDVDLLTTVLRRHLEYYGIFKKHSLYLWYWKATMSNIFLSVARSEHGTEIYALLHLFVSSGPADNWLISEGACCLQPCLVYIFCAVSRLLAPHSMTRNNWPYSLRANTLVRSLLHCHHLTWWAEWFTARVDE